MPLAAALASLMLAQAAAPAITSGDARLDECLQQARTDPATAIATASDWLEEAQGPAAALPRQCLGQSYVSLLRWDAAVEQFTAARDAMPEAEHADRARYGAMAGNAALGSGGAETALPLLTDALDDAVEAGARELAGQLAVDLAVAHYGLEQLDPAAARLEQARINAPQYPAAWHVSAMLARSQGDLEAASNFIATALALAPEDPDIGLEAGVIAALAGDDETARRNFEAVLANAPDTPHSRAASDYLAQLDEAAAQGE